MTPTRCNSSRTPPCRVGSRSSTPRTSIRSWQENRLLAAQLLAAADLWLFVTSAARYADAVPWEYLLSAAERSAAVAVVLDRVPPAAMIEVPPHLGRLMVERGLGRSPLFAVPETATNAAGMLPDAAVAPIRTWLATLAADQASRQAVVLQTLDGAIASIAASAPSVADAVDGEAEALAQLRGDADRSFAEAARTIAVQTSDGSLLRGEVLARWQDFVGTGEFMRAVEQRIGWLRDKLRATLRGEPRQVNEVKLAVESGLEAFVREEGDAAAERAESSWAAHPAGRIVIALTRDDLARTSPGFPDAVSAAIRSWQGDVLELVSEVGASKRSKARYLALGVNGVGVALMIVVFTQTGGLTGAEVGVAGGTAVLAQRLLEAVFGEDTVRRLTAWPRSSWTPASRRSWPASWRATTARLGASGRRPVGGRGDQGRRGRGDVLHRRRRPGAAAAAQAASVTDPVETRR